MCTLVRTLQRIPQPDRWCLKKCAFHIQRWMGGGSVGRVRCRLLALLGLCMAGMMVCAVALDGADQGRGRVMTIHHQQTIVTLQLGPRGNITRCDTIEVNSPDQERAALADITRQRPVTTVTFQQMMQTLLTCQRLDTVRRRRQPGSPPRAAPRQRWTALTLMRGLVPGTKWCGLGDTATGWNDLGPNADLDRCCRTHDLCPVKVKSYKRRYGLFNWGVYTKSHCACDQEFYRCLKSSDAKEADHIGGLFFDLLQPQCVQGHSCAPHEPADVCLERQKAERRPAALRFFDQPQRYDGARTSETANNHGGDGGEERRDNGEDSRETEEGGKATGESGEVKREDWRDRVDVEVHAGDGERATARTVVLEETLVEKESAGVTTYGSATEHSAEVTHNSARVTVKNAGVGSDTVPTSADKSGLSSFFRRIWRTLG